MPFIPHWRFEIERLIRKGIRNHFPETASNDIIVAEIQLGIHQLIQCSDLAKALKSVINHNTLPTRVHGPESRLIPLQYKIVTQRYGIIFEIVGKSTFSYLEYLLNNIFVIDISENFYLRVTRVNKIPGLIVPPDWFFDY